MPSDYTIPQASGIYKIVHVATGRMYIGSATNLLRRRNRHFNDLCKGIHDNLKLQRVYNKYGPDAFVFDVLQYVLLPEMLTDREQYFIDKYQPWFNIARIAGSNLGVKYSPESVEKSRVARTGLKRTPEQCERIGLPKRGKPSTYLGKKASPVTIERLRISHLGKKQSEETIRKRAEAHRGKKRKPESIEKSMKNYILTSPDGTEYVVHGLKQFCQSHNLVASALSQVVKGKHSHHRGWKARYREPE